MHDLGSARAADLSEYFGIDKGALSRQLSLLEDLRLITRETDTADRRSHRLTLTAGGRRRLTQARGLAKASSARRYRAGQPMTWKPSATCSRVSTPRPRTRCRQHDHPSGSGGDGGSVQNVSVITGIKNGVRTRRWRDGRLEIEDFPIEEISDHLQEQGALVWLDLCEPDHDLLRKLADELTLDSHAVEDAIASGERPKATRHATHTFVTVYGTRLDVGADQQYGPLDSRLQTSRVSAFVMPNVIVRIRSDDDFNMDQVVERWEDDPELLKLGSGSAASWLARRRRGWPLRDRPAHGRRDRVS